MVKESLAPGATVAEVARRNNVRANQLHLWRRQSRQAGLRPVSFLPVAVAPQRQRTGDGGIEIELEGGVRVRVDATVDEEALGRVLRALR